MKKTITKSLIAIFAIGMVITLTVNGFVQIGRDRSSFQQLSVEYFTQIEKIAEEKEVSLKRLKDDFKEKCIIRARAAAYMLEQQPQMAEDEEQCRLVASLLEVDELHLFNTDGVIYGGSQPEYYGMSMEDGEQIGFFAPMLTDRSMELCQDIEPNTAEGKMIQYAAVWSRDGKAIVQVGVNPQRVLEAIAGNDITDVFALITSDSKYTYYAIDTKTHGVLGATDEHAMGRSADAIGLDVTDASEKLSCSYQKINGTMQYCAIQKTDRFILVQACPLTELYEGIVGSTVSIGLYILALFFCLVLTGRIFLERKIVNSILNINKKLQKIGHGDWSVVLEEESTPEFAELSRHINSMVSSLLGFTEKVSRALELSDVPIGICEYVPAYNKMMATSRVQDILKMSDEEYHDFLKDPTSIASNKDGFFKKEQSLGPRIYALSTHKDCYIRVETFYYDESGVVVIIDVTADVMEKRKLEQERDTDMLTGLYNRRAFFRRTAELFASEEPRRDCLMIMFDLDHLKLVNDRYGHAAGDRYLQAFAEVLHSCEEENQIAARMGGDEFVLLVYGLDGIHKTEAITKELLIRRDCRTVPMENGEVMTLEYSMGWEYCPRTEEDYQAIIKTADGRMYEDKKRRKELRSRT